MSRYDDIINLPHPEPQNHPRMPMANRAAQFAPFAALTGHGAAIAETARLTEQAPELSADQQEELSRRLSQAIERKMPVTITYFQPDPRKQGGHYEEVTATIAKIDRLEQTISLSDGHLIHLHNVADIRI